MGIVELISSSAYRGRIGWTCHSKNEVVKAAMWIQSMGIGSGFGGREGSGMMRTKTLESGILIPEDFTRETAIDGSTSDHAVDRTFSFAIIVPYDLGLIRTSMLLFGNGDNQNGPDEDVFFSSGRHQ